MSSISQQQFCENYCKLCDVNCPENGKLKTHYKTQKHNRKEMELEDINII